MTCVQSKLAKVFLHMLINQHIADREKQMYKENMADLLSSEFAMTSHSLGQVLCSCHFKTLHNGSKSSQVTARRVFYFNSLQPAHINNPKHPYHSEIIHLFLFAHSYMLEMVW